MLNRITGRMGHAYVIERILYEISAMPQVLCFHYMEGVAYGYNKSRSNTIANVFITLVGIKTQTIYSETMSPLDKARL